MSPEESLYLKNRASIVSLKTNNSILKWGLHKRFRQEHKSLFWILDIMWICSVVFNLGALVITNVMVVKNHPTITFVEANPIMAKREGYATSTDSRAISKFYGFVRHGILWSALLSIYIWKRLGVRDYSGWYALLALSMVYLVMMSTDFLNDFGYWIGMKLYGG